MSRSPKPRPLARFVFLVYAAVMLWLLFGRSFGWDDGLSYRETLAQNVNFTPLYTIRNYWYVIRTHGSLLIHCAINLLGNVLLFIPLGYLLPDNFLRQRRFHIFALTCFIGDLLVEITQLLTLLGSFDIDDVILNLTGLLMGFLFWKLTHRKR